MALNGLVRRIGVDGEAKLSHRPRIPSPECGVVHSGVDGDFRFMLRLVLWYFGILPLALPEHWLLRMIRLLLRVVLSEPL